MLLEVELCRTEKEPSVGDFFRLLLFFKVRFSMGKKKFYGVIFSDNTSVIYCDYERYKQSIKGASNSKHKGFNKLDEAKKWTGDSVVVDSSVAVMLVNNLKQPLQIKKKKYHAVASGRFVGVTTSESKVHSATHNYRKSKYKKNFKDEEAAYNWLEKNGISKHNRPGIYAVARGRNTGVFRYLNTYEKNMSNFSGAKGRGNFHTIEEAKQWLTATKKQLDPPEYFAVANGHRRGVYKNLETYEKNMKDISDAWGKRGFVSEEEARTWLEERLNYVKELEKGQNILSVSKLITFDSQKLPIVFTDGSFYKTQQKYSSSVVICNIDGSISTFTKAKSISHKQGSSLSEIEAFFLCLKLVFLVYGHREFILVHDYAHLKEIGNGQFKIRGIKNTLHNQISRFISDNKLNIHYINVKSHTGILGNTLADKLAKDACRSLDSLSLLRNIDKILP